MILRALLLALVLLGIAPASTGDAPGPVWPTFPPQEIVALVCEDTTLHVVIPNPHGGGQSLRKLLVCYKVEPNDPLDSPRSLLRLDDVLRNPGIR